MIRKLILVSLLILPARFCMAFGDVWTSSYTATADTNKPLCTSTKAFLHGVCVSSPTAAASTFTVYKSSMIPVTITAMDATKNGCLFFDTLIISSQPALAYTNSSTANVNILYQCK